MFTPTPPTPHPAPLPLPVSEETVTNLRVPAADDATRRVLVDDSAAPSGDFGPADELDLDRDTLFAGATHPPRDRYGSLIAATAAAADDAEAETVRDLAGHGARTYAGAVFSPTPPGWATNDPHAAPTREGLAAAPALDAPSDTPTPRLAAAHDEPDTAEELAPAHADSERALELSARLGPPLPPLPALITPTPTHTPTPVINDPQSAVPPPLPSLVMRGLQSGGVRPADDPQEPLVDDDALLTVDESDAAEGPTLIDHERRSVEIALVPGMPQPPSDDSAALAGFAPRSEPSSRRGTPSGELASAISASLQGGQSVPSLASLQRQARGAAGRPMAAPPTLPPDQGALPTQDSVDQPLRVIPAAPIVPLASQTPLCAPPRRLDQPRASARRPRRSSLRWIWLAASVSVVVGGALTGALVRHSSAPAVAPPNDLLDPRAKQANISKPSTPARPAHEDKAGAGSSSGAPTGEPTADAKAPRDQPTHSTSATAPRLAEARTLLKRGHYRAAHRAFQALLDRRAGFEPALIGRARAAVELALPHPLLALDGSQRARDEARVLRARVQTRHALRERDRARAARATRALLALPRYLRRDARVQLWLGELLAARERTRRAGRVLERLLSRRVDVRRAPLVRAAALLALSRIRLATDYRAAATSLARRALDVARRRELAPTIVMACRSQLLRCQRARRTR